ncbi:MAG TPA: hypothetical protein VH600_22445 [Burkholderiales bacterium]
MKCGVAVALALAAGLLAAPAPSSAQAAGPSAAATGDSGPILLTIFLRHDQSKTLPQIQQHLKETGFDSSFPPQGIEIVSWYVMMGIGQVVTLRVPPARLREVNRVIEEKGWGAYRTEFYATYDYLPVWKQAHPQR